MAAHHQRFSNKIDRVGLALIGTSGLVSSLSTFFLLLYIMWHAFLTREKSSPVHRGVRAFTRSSLGCYLLSLLFCDFLQGSAFIINYRWAKDGVMTEDQLCTIQGAVSEAGDLGTAIWSTAISLHTFWLLFLVKKPHYLVAPIVLAIGWTLLIVLPILGPTVFQTKERGVFYGLSGAWCWIGAGYGPERLVYLYIWVFAALISSSIIYTLIYLRFANFITVGKKGQLKIRFRRPKNQEILHSAVSAPVSPSGISLEVTGTTSRRQSTSLPGCFDWARDTRDGAISSNSGNTSDAGSGQSPTIVSKHLKQIARRLMWYPILYAIVVLPVSVCRMGVLAGWQPPFGLLVFAGICFSSSGFTNSVLFIFTRHSFIKNIVRTNTTRIHVTTTRITVREGDSDVELSQLGTPTTNSQKSPYFLNNNSDSLFEPRKEKNPTLESDELSDPEQGRGEKSDPIHISVYGK